MRLAIVYPVLVTTDTNMGVSGNSLRNSLIIGLVATISPTEEACIQIQFLPATLSKACSGKKAKTLNHAF